MALAGMRRGEIAGQRWADVDFTNKLIHIGRTRVDVRGHAFDQTDPKTKSAARTLPIPDGPLAELKAAKARQAAEQLAMGDAYSDHGHVVCNEAGEPYHPSTLTKLWSAAIRDLDVPQVRLHNARHTCATLMQVRGIASDASFGVVGDWESVRDFGFGAAAGPA
jgi:integrase